MTQVKLMGELGEKFGSEWECVDTSIRDILKCIDCQTEGLKDYFSECHLKNVQFSIQTGENLIEEFPELYLNVAREEVIITPVPAGSGKGLGKLITGLLILAAMFFMPGIAGGFLTTSTSSSLGAGAVVQGTHATLLVGGSQGMSVGAALAAGASPGALMMSGAASLTLPGVAVMMLGANLALMGLAEMSAPDPDKTTNDPSYLFNGAENHIEQGQPVPLLYGELTVGGAPIYQGYAPGVISTYSKGNTYTTQNTWYDGTTNDTTDNASQGTTTSYKNSTNGSTGNNPSTPLFGDTSDNASYGGVPFEAQKSRITAAEEKQAMQDEFIDNGELR